MADKWQINGRVESIDFIEFRYNLCHNAILKLKLLYKKNKKT